MIENLLNIRRGLMFILSQLRYIDETKPGKPYIEKDLNGGVIGYEITTGFTTTYSELVDTEFLPFDGKDFDMHIYAKFSYSNQTYEYPTLISCMDSSSPWPGIVIRYEYNELYIIVNGDNNSKNYYRIRTDSSSNVNIDITYRNGVMSITNNGSTIVSNLSVQINLDNISLTLGSELDENGNITRIGIATFYEFYIKKI